MEARQDNPFDGYIISPKEKIDIIYDFAREDQINIIMELYKKISQPAEKQIWEKTEKDISDDVISAKIDLSLDDFVKNKVAEEMNLRSAAQLICTKIKWIPILLDLMYAYYVRFIDRQAMVYECPHTIFKLHMVLMSINTLYDDKYKILNQSFEQITVDEWFQKFRANPPIYMNSQYSIYDLDKKIINVCAPIMKNIINELFRLSKEDLGQPDAMFIKQIGDNEGDEEN